MKRRAIGILIFCVALLGAIVAGYWDLLNSEQLRLAKERAGEAASRFSVIVGADRPAEGPVARDGADRQGAPSPGGNSDRTDVADAGETTSPSTERAEEAAPPAGVAPDAAARDDAPKGAGDEGDAAMARTAGPGRSDMATTIEPAASASPAEAATPRQRDAASGPASNEPGSSQSAVVTADEGSPAGPGEDRVGDPAAQAAVASSDDPATAGEARNAASGREPEQAGSEHAAVAGSETAGETPVAAAGAGEEDGLAPPRFDILRVETDGSTVIAGRGPAGSSITLVSGGEEIATTAATDAGEFVIVLDRPLEPGDYQMRIEATMPDGRRVVSEETAIVSVPEPGSESELLAMVEAPNAASRLISLPSAPPSPKDETSDIAAGEALPAGPAVDPASGGSRSADDSLMLPRTAEAEPEAAETVVELPERVSTFLSRARTLSEAADGLDDGEALPAAGSIAEDARAVAEEGRALAEALPLAADPQEGESAASLTELVRRTAETADEVGETAASADPAGTAEAADRLADLADETEIRLSSLGGAEPSDAAGADANAPPVDEDGAAALAVEAVEIEKGTIYIAGRADSGSTVRVYLDNEHLADDKVAAGDRFLISTQAHVATGDHLVRADQIGAEGRVVARAEVPFFKPEGETMSAIAPAVSAPSQDAGVEMLPAADIGRTSPAGGERADAAGGETPNEATSTAGDADSAARAAETMAEENARPSGAAGPRPQEDARSADAGEIPSPAAVRNGAAASGDPGSDGAGSSREAGDLRPGGAAAGADAGARSAVAAAAGPPDASAQMQPGKGEDADAATAEAEGKAGPGRAVDSTAAQAAAGSPAASVPASGEPAGAGDDPTPVAAIPATAAKTAGAPAGEAIGDASEDGGTPNPFAVDSPTAVPAPGANGETPASGGPAAPGEPRDASPATQEAGPPAAGGPEIAVNRQPALEQADSRVLIRKGDTLWEISRETYGRGSRYTVIYLANGDQIRDPDRIYPGQVFRLPENLMDAVEASREAN